MGGRVAARRPGLKRWIGCDFDQDYQHRAMHAFWACKSSHPLAKLAGVALPLFRRFVCLLSLYRIGQTEL